MTKRMKAAGIQRTVCRLAGQGACALALGAVLAPALAQHDAAGAPVAAAQAQGGQAQPIQVLAQQAAAADREAARAEAAQQQSMQQPMEEDAAPAQPAAQIVVTGRRPGPGVWKVSRDGHVLWVFGLYSPLPRNMEWDAGRVERLVAQSQEVLLPPSAQAKLGFWKGLTLLPALPGLIGITKNPDGATLQEVLPPDVYARWSGLKAKYIGKDDDLETQRPLFAAQRLLRAGRDRNGLADSGVVREQIFQIARKNKVKLVPTGFELPLETAQIKQGIKDFKAARLEDVACFDKTLASLEGDLDAMRTRANAWADGDIAAIRSLDYSAREDACDAAILTSNMARNNADFRTVRERLRTTWLDAAQQALDRNSVTFAILDMKDLVERNGYLATLQERGYTVESPK
ncbi:TraB/GumN family protein [Massilia forsythiae]|uniref:TraB/GumN family protein n=1 Tax=Massilia forsythiae TaxID=2728020 RepID=A0A7Z2ZSJ6_9BURK|nr:TraB/GumN family protein [Massilia forsythiae]QJE00384.1 TraB/GumN family protein [Massilia forsythiae]